MRLRARGGARDEGEEDDDVRGDVLVLRVGYLVGVLAMGVCYVVSALLFYPPEAEGLLPNLLACVAYDMSYLLIEAVLTELLLLLPPMLDAILYLRFVATTEKGDPTLRSF